MNSYTRHGSSRYETSLPASFPEYSLRHSDAYPSPLSTAVPRRLLTTTNSITGQPASHTTTHASSLAVGASEHGYIPVRAHRGSASASGNPSSSVTISSLRPSEAEDPYAAYRSGSETPVSSLRDGPWSPGPRREESERHRWLNRGSSYWRQPWSDGGMGSWNPERRFKSVSRLAPSSSMSSDFDNRFTSYGPAAARGNSPYGQTDRSRTSSGSTSGSYSSSESSELWKNHRERTPNEIYRLQEEKRTAAIFKRRNELTERDWARFIRTGGDPKDLPRKWRGYFRP